MNMTHYPRLEETVCRKTLGNGLTLMVVPKPGFTRKVAYFAANYGSVHTDFTLDGVHHKTPAGVAHYLEHRMFDLPGRDVMAEFAALGVNPNAFTSYDVTAYYFSCTDNFQSALELLLEFVSTPYFTEESVRKEIGIIDQEIGMNEDSPDSRVFDSLAAALYREHRIRVPILGTCETIRQITPQMLYDCHRAFYTPGNMLLCVIGDVDPDRVADIAREMLGDGAKPVGEKLRPWNEPVESTGTDPVEQMEVSMPTFQLGFKCEPADRGEEAILQEIIGDLAAEALFGESSETYLKLYEEGIIDSSFGGGFETVDGMAMLLCSGDSDSPEAVREALLVRAEEIAREGIDEADFQRMKRSAMGRRIRDLDSFNSTCFRVCAYHFADFDYFRFPPVYRQVTADQVREFLGRVVRRSRCCLAIIEPNQEDA